MFQRFHEKRDEAGFTLIELLVVILIVAILAAVAIPVFLRQREKGYRDQLQSALKNAATAMESYATSNDGAYPDPGAVITDGAMDAAHTDPEGLGGEGFNPTAGVTLTIVSADTTDGYCMTATHTNLDAAEIWSYNSATGEPVEADCAAVPAP